MLHAHNGRIAVIRSASDCRSFGEHFYPLIMGHGRRQLLWVGVSLGALIGDPFGRWMRSMAGNTCCP